MNMKLKLMKQLIQVYSLRSVMTTQNDTVNNVKEGKKAFYKSPVLKGSPLYP